MAVAPRCCLSTPAGDYLSRQGVAVSLVKLRLQQSAGSQGAPAGTGGAPAVQLEQAQAVHSFLLQQQRLRRITSAALVLASTPEALRVVVRGTLRIRTPNLPRRCPSARWIVRLSGALRHPCPCPRP